MVTVGRVGWLVGCCESAAALRGQVGSRPFGWRAFVSSLRAELDGSRRRQ